MNLRYEFRIKGSVSFILILITSCFLILYICNLPLVRNLKKIPLKDKSIPKEFQLGKNFWRPDRTDPKIPYDFDDQYDDRIQRQRNWIQNMTRSSIFQNLKRKRILVEDAFLDVNRNGTLDCFGGLKEWESKCLLELEPNSQQAEFYPKNINDFDAVDLSMNNAFLATYWRGADIPIPYYKWIPHTIPSKGEHTIKKEKNPVGANAGKKNYAEGKSKLAAIVVSNCNPNNDRLEYVKQMQRHMSVQIYGYCGHLNCTGEYACYQSLGKDYKFYLAFENANCRDYITEKFFINALYNDMVPIVLGAHRKDYISAAPPNSYIHVEDFDSPMELTDYLKVIDENDELYNSFFEWKSYGSIEYGYHYDFYCRTCALLFIADYVKPPVWTPGSTWESENVCLAKGRWYWDRPNDAKLEIRSPARPHFFHLN